jgi:ectoine hydroxylase-related dioxygenase (phytanoyl-CoA dioxygenase family)
MTEDLSRYHAPVGNLLDQLPSADLWSQFRLRDDQLDFYRENGYVSKIRILTDTQVDILRNELQELVDPDHPGNGLFHEFNSNESTDPSRVLFHALGGWRIAAGFHDLVFHPAIAVAAHQLLEGPVRFWHDQLFCKPAHHGAVVAWHQDYSYWTRTQPMGHLTCWIGLDDATRNNGCLQYIPQSHRWDLLPITGLAGDMDAIRAALSDAQWSQFKPVPIELQRGEASLHHPLLVHGSFENSSHHPRRAVVINLCRDGTHSDSDEPLLQGMPVVARGTPLGGQFFPLLSDNR